MKKIINNLFHRLKEDSLAKRNEASNRVVEYKELKDVRSCLVFWTVCPDQGKWLDKVMEKLPQVKVSKLCFVPAGAESPVREDIVTMSNEDLGFGGKIQNQRLHDLLEHQYDLLIDLNPVANALINYVLTNSRSNCVVGMKKENGMADFVVDVDTDPLQWMDQAFGVLSEIKRY